MTGIYIVQNTSSVKVGDLCLITNSSDLTRHGIVSFLASAEDAPWSNIAGAFQGLARVTGPQVRLPLAIIMTPSYIRKMVLSRSCQS